MPIYRKKAVWCVIVVLVVVLAGLAYGFLESNASAVSLSGTVYVDANISMSQLMGGSCYPNTWTVEAILPFDFYNKLLSLGNEERPLITSQVSLCLTAVALCQYNQQTWGEPCDLSTIYVTDTTAIPYSVTMVGYVLGVNVSLNNRLPAQIDSVTASSNGERLPTNLEQTSCNAHCTIDANVTLGPVSGLTKVNLTVNAKMPLNWFMWGNFGMVQRTIVVSFEFDPSSMTVQFG
jgi:hypothetical protein